MKKRLCDLVDVVENNKSCVVLEVKESVQPIDLIKLGGFYGNETMFRLSKGTNEVSLTIFREGEKPEEIRMGHTQSNVSADGRQRRSQICEAVNLDFGIVTGANSTLKAGNGRSINGPFEATSGPRDLDSCRMFELTVSSAGDCILHVNKQHIANFKFEQFEQWCSDRNIEVMSSSRTTNGRWTYIKGEFVRAEKTHDLDKSFYETSWNRFDIEEIFKHYEIPVTEENIAAMVPICKSAIDNNIGEWSWEVLADAIYPEKDKLIEAAQGSIDVKPEKGIEGLIGVAHGALDEKEENTADKSEPVAGVDR